VRQEGRKCVPPLRKDGSSSRVMMFDNERMADADLVVVHTFNNRPEAELTRSALEAAGIEAMVQSDDGGSMRPALAWAGTGVQLIVRTEDASAARDILDTPAKVRPDIA
jgi:hypothetical protein